VVSPRLFAAAFVLLLTSVPASAAPVTYGLSLGSVTMQARLQTPGNALVFDETMPLGTDSFITWDSAVVAAGGGGTLDNLLHSVVPVQGPFTPLVEWGSFDTLTFDSLELFPAAGYGMVFSFPLPAPSFQIIAEPVDLNIFYTETTSGSSGPSMDLGIVLLPPPRVSSTITFSDGDQKVVMNSIVLGTLDGTPFGEVGNDLDFEFSFSFFGDSNVVPTPEPSTAVLLATGLAGVAARRRHRPAERG
jgi:hypothetical protein